MTYLIYTTGVFAGLVALFLGLDWLFARWERRERELWDKAFGGSTAARSGGERDV